MICFNLQWWTPESFSFKEFRIKCDLRKHFQVREESRSRWLCGPYKTTVVRGEEIVHFGQGGSSDADVRTFCCRFQNVAVRK